MSQTETNKELLGVIDVIMLDKKRSGTSKFFACTVGLLRDISTNIAIIADKMLEVKKDE